jgi:hypothetical protein
LKRVSIAFGMSAPTKDQYPPSPAEVRARMSAGRRASALSQPAAAASMTPAMQRAAEIAKEALRRYKPRFYPGKIKFVRAQILTDFPADPVGVWAGLAQEFGVETVPGDHLGMIGTYPESLGAVMSDHLRNAR